MVSWGAVIDYRAQPSSWYAVGWVPIDEDKSDRPKSGYDSAGARNMRIHQECWRHLLKRDSGTVEYDGAFLAQGSKCIAVRNCAR